MKCPKCDYLGFEHVERCRNCGYDFLLSRSVDFPELSLRQAAAEPNPIGDLELVDRTAQDDTDTFASELDTDIDRVLSRAKPSPVENPAPPVPRSVSHAPVAIPKMPLFPAVAEDAPLITKPSPPRQPLAVRRSTPEVTRARAEAPRPPSLDLPLEPRQPETAGAASRHARAAPAGRGWSVSPEANAETATLGERISAALIDLSILATIDAAVVYLTMQICGVSLAELAIVPKAPLVAFLLVQNGGYLVTFTVSGQTLGKMAAGIKVVPDGADAPLDVGRAVRRTCLWAILAVPAGLGFVSAFFSRDHRGLHDRFAGTRVVRASA
jgi:uncharacterized RDD family membrane protein YckC